MPSLPGLKFYSLAVALALLLVSCGDGSLTTSQPPPDWQARPIDGQVAPKPVDVFLPTPAPVDVGLPTADERGDHPEARELPSLTLTKKTLVFTPSPLYALFIYEGTYTNYDEAVSTANPVASVPAKQTCPQNAGRCWHSPVVLSHCDGCEKLTSEKTYTAFLLQRSSEPLHKVLKVTLRFD